MPATRIRTEQEVETMNAKRELIIASAIIVAATAAVVVWAVQDLQVYPTQEVVLHSWDGEGLIPRHRRRGAKE